MTYKTLYTNTYAHTVTLLTRLTISPASRWSTANQALSESA